MKNIPYKKAHRLKSNRRSTAAVAQKQNQKTAAPAPPVPGDRAALIAPSFAVTPEQLANAEKSIRLLGLTPVIYPSCRSRRDYLAGSDRLRARDLEAAFSDSSVRAVFCLRGGYGASRLLNLIDFQTIRKNPKFFIGFSDITALHTALNQECGLITYHGPMPTAPYTACDSRLTLFFLHRMLYGTDLEKGLSIRLKKAKLLCRGEKRSFSPEKICSDRSSRASEKEITASGEKNTCEKNRTPSRNERKHKETIMSGRLCGGNLTVLASALGSSYEIETEGKILFLEDVGERTYRIDRAFTSLKLAEKISRCSGILLGTFSGCTPDPGGRSCQQIIREIAEPLGIPVVSGLPCGHSLPHLTLPLGAECQVIKVSGSDRLAPGGIPFSQAPGGTPELRSSLRFSRCSDPQKHSLENPGYLVLRLSFG